MGTYAAAGTKYETESNNTPSSAIITHDDYDNYSALPAYSVLPTTDIFIASNFAWPGQMAFYNSSIYAKLSSTGDNSTAIGNYAASALSNVKLIIFAAPTAGDVDPYYGSLIDEARTKGAFCAIG